MFDTTFLQLEAAARMLQTDVDTLLVAAVERRIQLYALVNYFGPAELGEYTDISDGHGTDWMWDSREASDRYFDFVHANHLCAIELLRYGRTTLAELLADSDEPETAWRYMADSFAAPGIGKNDLYVRRRLIESLSSGQLIAEAGDVKERGVPRHAAPRDTSLIATLSALMAAWPGGKLPSAKDLEKAAQAVGVSVSDDTIRKVLNAAHAAAPSLPLPK